MPVWYFYVASIRKKIGQRLVKDRELLNENLPELPPPPRHPIARKWGGGSRRPRDPPQGTPLASGMCLVLVGTEILRRANDSFR